MPPVKDHELLRAQESGRPRKSPRILVLGGGSLGLYATRRLRRRLARRDASIVVVDPRPYMTYAPFLPEAAAGSIDARYAVAPFHKAFKGVTTLQGKVSEIRHGERRVQVTPAIGEPYWVTYDHLIVGLGSVARTLPIPGLAEEGIGFKQIEEAIALRNHVLGRIDLAASTWDADLRRRMLTFTFVGGGFAGIEALGEVEDMARYAVRVHPGMRPEDLRFVLVEGSYRVLPEVSEELGGYTLEQLRKRNIEVHLSSFLDSCEGGHVKLSNGTEFESDTVVWTAGVKANPVLGSSDLPLDPQGRVRTNAALQVVTEDGVVVPDVYAGGDCAAVPDLVNPGQICPPNAQHAVRQGTHLGENLARVLRSAEVHDYKHKNVGAVASLGTYQGVAQMFGRFKVRGFLAWVLHRTYHLSAMPTLDRKLKIMAGWTATLLFRREVVALGSVMQDPRHDFLAAAVPAKQRPDDAVRSDGEVESDEAAQPDGDEETAEAAQPVGDVQADEAAQPVGDVQSDGVEKLSPAEQVGAAKQPGTVEQTANRDHDARG